MGTAGTAVITGALGGLGSAFARALAGRGYDLLLTDTDAEGLARLAGDLRARYPVQTETIAADLTSDHALDRLQTHIGSLDDLTMLVNNAGFGTFSLFHEADLARQLDMVRVHVMATMRLCHAALPGMLSRRHGALINVASVSAFWRFPRDATYIGTKSFLVAFSECLAIELAGTGVAIEAFCPAWVHTGFHTTQEYVATGYTVSPPPFPEWLYVSPEESVSSALNALGRGPVVHTPTFRARAAASFIGSRTGLAILAQLRRRRARASAQS